MGFLLQFLVGVFLLFVLAFTYEHVYKLYSSINFYKAQGVTILPGAGRPFLGNLIDYAQYAKEAKVCDEPLHTRVRWILEKLLDRGSGYKP